MLPMIFWSVEYAVSKSPVRASASIERPTVSLVLAMAGGQLLGLRAVSL